MSIDPTNRELEIKLESSIERLADGIERLIDRFDKFEEKQYEPLQKTVERHDKVLNEINGVWKFVLIITTLVAAFNVLLTIKKSL